MQDAAKTYPPFKIKSLTPEKLEQLRGMHEKGIAEAKEAARAAAQAQWLAQLEVGERIGDGTVYAGVSPQTGKAMFAMPGDALDTRGDSIVMNFAEAARVYAEKMNACKAFGHADWRVPTEEELNSLFENRYTGAFRQSFNTSSAKPESNYWSADAVDNSNARSQDFSSGEKNIVLRDRAMSVRLVRG